MFTLSPGGREALPGPSYSQLRNKSTNQFHTECIRSLFFPASLANCHLSQQKLTEGLELVIKKNKKNHKTKCLLHLPMYKHSGDRKHLSCTLNMTEHGQLSDCSVKPRWRRLGMVFRVICCRNTDGAHTNWLLRLSMYTVCCLCKQEGKRLTFSRQHGVLLAYHAMRAHLNFVFITLLNIPHFMTLKISISNVNVITALRPQHDALQLDKRQPHC